MAWTFGPLNPWMSKQVCFGCLKLNAQGVVGTKGRESRDKKINTTRQTMYWELRTQNQKPHTLTVFSCNSNPLRQPPCSVPDHYNEEGGHFLEQVCLQHNPHIFILGHFSEQGYLQHNRQMYFLRLQSKLRGATLPPLIQNIIIIMM